MQRAICLSKSFQILLLNEKFFLFLARIPIRRARGLFSYLALYLFAAHEDQQDLHEERLVSGRWIL